MVDEHFRLWPDDVPINTGFDGVHGRLGGQQEYLISRHVLYSIPDLRKRYLTQVTEYISSRKGTGCVEITNANIDEVINQRLPTVTQKIDRLILALAKLSNFQQANFILQSGKADKYLLMREAGVSTSTELVSLLYHLHTKSLVVYQPTSSGPDVTVNIEAIIKAEEGMQQRGQSRTGFVAMWFGGEVASAYADGMKPAIEDNGYEAVRIDARQHNNKIDDEIISEIRKARFVVADFSCGDEGARGGVYFEAGFAQGLGIPVIFSVREADLGRVHFDTRQYNHIVWKEPADLHVSLKNRIGATIGQHEDN